MDKKVQYTRNAPFRLLPLEDYMHRGHPRPEGYLFLCAYISNYGDQPWKLDSTNYVLGGRATTLETKSAMRQTMVKDCGMVSQLDNGNLSLWIDRCMYLLMQCYFGLVLFFR